MRSYLTPSSTAMNGRGKQKAPLLEGTATDGRGEEPQIKHTRIMAFNFLEIKRLGTMYRAVEAALQRFPNESLQKTQDILGQQILAESQVDSIEGIRISIDCRIRTFPRPKYAIGNYVKFFDPSEETDRGLITGMSYGMYHTTQWFYEINVDGLPDDSIFVGQENIKKILPPWESPEESGLSEETVALLESFLDNFEKSHGPLFPDEEKESVA
ncbi:hypothetical protein PJF56_10625 [Roseofilum sp. BLCC_M91]|uniref:Uncharacterized protein n=1 Tax=Roseofilum halophilum BLCC-M91 TaxID=3022259 RepID=A0ABT7BJI4_9CYAN|nr:hypothetical protein [Roseofilum halophilum]MDJ1179319.1 hypothetical protein [Roseofilum halophilum BLCC-M91]